VALELRPDLDEFVAHLPEVGARLDQAAETGASRIRAVISPHNRTGRLFRSVSVQRSFTGTDRWINVDAPYAAPVNYGFIHNRTHEFIEGIHFIQIALGGGL
jgi:hypothetical protein